MKAKAFEALWSFSLSLKNKIYDLRRKFFGTYEIESPITLASENPYTYFLPQKNWLDAIETDDLVKLVFLGKPVGREWGAERMWVKVTSFNKNSIKGTLENEPSDMPQISKGDKVNFLRSDIIDILFDDRNNERDIPPQNEPKKYWDRCLVDDCILEGNAKVHLIYREEPNLTETDDKFPDSGWRIRGDYRKVSDKDYNARTASYIALGKVLNQDDSWLHLIDEPIGSRYIKNFEKNTFELEE